MSRTTRAALLLLACASAAPGGDDFAARLRDDPAFEPVRALPAERWDTWIYMPWRYRWEIGTGDAGGRFCRDYGINGGFTDHGEGPFAWLERWELRFYNDHTAGKGSLFLKDPDPRAATRPVPLDRFLLSSLKQLASKRVERLRGEPGIVAYALDDEISTGILLRPVLWRLHDAAPAPPRHLPSLDAPIGRIDLSPVLDFMQSQDSEWAGFLGALVEECNRVDPRTPCGFVGAQAPNLFGGYDYAKLMRKVQFLEVYDQGSAPAIARSFARGIPIVSTHFQGDDSWKAWYGFAQGQRGMIGWVEGWFENGKPKPWLDAFAPTLRELSQVQGPKLHGARRIHDGVAIYYSHPSIQVSWLLDAEPHGKTWPNRNGDARLGTSHLVRKAWEFLLADAGLQSEFLSYERVARNGVPAEFRAVILPACFALSDAEAQKLAEFAARGGVVVADFMCGLFDERGRGRTKGALDDLFGVRHDGSETRAEFFGGRLFVESDQEKGYGSGSFRQLLDTAPCRTRDGFAIAERRLPPEGKGRYLNLSPQRYLQFREEGRAEASHVARFVAPLGIEPWVLPEGPTGRPRNVEVTYFAKGERTYLFVVANPPLQRDGTRRPSRAPIRFDLRFAAAVRDVVDERTGAKLGDGDRFPVEFDPKGALLLSLRR